MSRMILYAIAAGVILYFAMGLFQSTEDLMDLQQDRIKKLEKILD